MLHLPCSKVNVVDQRSRGQGFKSHFRKSRGSKSEKKKMGQYFCLEKGKIEEKGKADRQTEKAAFQK